MSGIDASPLTAFVANIHIHRNRTKLNLPRQSVGFHSLSSRVIYPITYISVASSQPTLVAPIHLIPKSLLCFYVHGFARVRRENRLTPASMNWSAVGVNDSRSSANVRHCLSRKAMPGPSASPIAVSRMAGRGHMRGWGLGPASLGEGMVCDWGVSPKLP